MHPRRAAAAGLMGVLAVVAGTFGAHALHGRVDPELLAVYDTGTRYHLIHAAALLALAVAPRIPEAARTLNTASTFFTAGIVLFSGSLYTLALTGARWLGMVTPFGGVCFLIGWATVLVWAIKNSKR